LSCRQLVLQVVKVCKKRPDLTKMVLLDYEVCK